MQSEPINEPVHQIFATREFMAFKANPYNNESIQALVACLKRFCAGPHNLTLIKQHLSRVFSLDEGPALRIFEYEIERIEHPDRSALQKS